MSERSLVLVVDDDKDLRDSVGELLEDASRLGLAILENMPPGDESVAIDG